MTSPETQRQAAEVICRLRQLSDINGAAISSPSAHAGTRVDETRRLPERPDKLAAALASFARG